jgi:hypothetical protein
LQHSLTLTLPNGWSVVKEESEGENIGPSDDDLMAIADAVREVAAAYTQEPVATEVPSQEIGRRGHLRALPSN